jgi:hypothetical protein
VKVKVITDWEDETLDGILATIDEVLGAEKAGKDNLVKVLSKGAENADKLEDRNRIL